ncbi:dihydrodipicolinate synthase family protein [Paracoccus laeviglucosivorans]|uniref:4-hydroxy-tetrahydrodipicolinate synthase n=1 Tax=Paracoccus laeviglucosivorans TaxID=1197861 RepID=A0A521BJM0_9RHOB|nr:dihydrodipicolinate synthase family protein [Paracoccus laeviglucosivorans]SMO47061.1 4-hydroxy-tetrahydrodipicolinate synthase [Paracoccus laeviglucosivorans]
MQATDLHGMFPALPTPLDADGKLDLAALATLVETNIAGGARGLVPMGGTGEFTALSHDDRVAVVRETVRLAAGRVPVVPGVVSPGRAEALATGHAFRDAGAAGLMLVTPFYVIPSQAGVQEYFRSYRAEVGLPLVYYDVPSRTGFVTAVETVRDLAADGTIIGMKVCNTDAHYFNRLATALEGRIALLSGDDMLYVIHAMHGAVGGVLASAPMLPAYWTAIHDRVEAGDFAGAIAMHRKLIPVFDALFAEVNPGPLKLMMSQLGTDVGPVSLPLRAPSEATQALIARAVQVVRAEAMA